MMKDYRCRDCNMIFHKEPIPEIIVLCPHCEGEGRLLLPEEINHDDWKEGVMG